MISEHERLEAMRRDIAKLREIQEMNALTDLAKQTAWGWFPVFVKGEPRTLEKPKTWAQIREEQIKAIPFALPPKRSE